jgi:hypothetical protein
MWDDTHSWRGCVDGGNNWEDTSCGDITISGQCYGDVVKYCENDVLKSYDCAQENKVCGLIIEDNHAWRGCMDKTDVYVPDDSCNEDSYSPRCSGDIFMDCVNGHVVKENCASKNQRCKEIHDGPITGAGCAGDDVCKDSESKCDGNTLYVCVYGQFIPKDCASEGKVCGKNTDSNTSIEYTCISKTTPETPGEPCNMYEFKTHCNGNVKETCFDNHISKEDCESYGIGYGCKEKVSGSSQTAYCTLVDKCHGIKEPVCEGDMLTNCVSEQITKRDCAALGKKCGLNDAGVNDCIGTSSHTPDPNSCDEKEYKTHCEGNTIKSCEKGKIESEYCASQGLKCVVQENGGMTVVTCSKGECSTSKCNGNTLMMCTLGTYIPMNCSNFDKQCVESDGDATCK